LTIFFKIFKWEERDFSADKELHDKALHFYHINQNDKLLDIRLRMRKLKEVS
jgi:hypothetical protein